MFHMAYLVLQIHFNFFPWVSHILIMYFDHTRPTPSRPSQPHILFFKSTVSPISAATGPFTSAWVASQKPHPWRILILLLQQSSAANSSSGRNGAWSCADLVQETTATVNSGVQQSYHVQKTVFCIGLTQSLSLTIFLPLLLWCSLSLRGKKVWHRYLT